MFEDFSRNSRFLEWLETVAGDGSQAYPHRETLTEDAAAFLARWDRTRKEIRLLEERYRELATGVAALAESSPKAAPEKLLDSLSARLEASTEATKHATSELEKALDAARTERAQVQSELERSREQASAIQTELEREQRRLEPVLRYAYNLRRLMQRIHAIGKLTPEIRGYIEQLLEAGGVSIQRDENPPPRATTPHHPSAASQPDF